MDWINSVAEALAPGWVGSLIGLAGLVAAVAIYFFTRQRTILAYQAHGQRLLGHAASGLPPSVTVQYEGREIAKLTRSILIVWNTGEKTIPGSDIVGTDPLRLVLAEDSEILSAEVIQQSRDAIRSTVNLPARPAHQATMTFDFLDRNDGFVVEVLHTGDEILPVVKGTVRSMPAGLKRVWGPTIDGVLMWRVRMSSRFFRIGIWVFSGFCLLVGFVIAGALLFAPSMFEKAAQTPPPGRFSAILLALTYVGIGGAVLYTSRRRHPKSLMVVDRQ